MKAILEINNQAAAMRQYKLTGTLGIWRGKAPASPKRPSLYVTTALSLKHAGFDMGSSIDGEIISARHQYFTREIAHRYRAGAHLFFADKSSIAHGTWH